MHNENERFSVITNGVKSEKRFKSIPKAREAIDCDALKAGAVITVYDEFDRGYFREFKASFIESMNGIELTSVER